MANNATRSQQVAAGQAAAHAALSQESGVRHADSSAPGSPESGRKPVGYGLPCSKCRLYYPADLDICPTCQHNERVSPVVPQVPPRVALATPDPVPDGEAIEQEREEFLRQFKSQLLVAHSEVVNAPEAFCTLAEHHGGQPASAEVCKTCYEHLQEQVDIYEAALHMDLKDATQIIYDAVWADSSDPNKTYQNAASALLTELRKRAGVSTLLGPFQPLSD
jgi:hypothetical protein